MLIVFRLIVFYYCLTISTCNVEKTEENLAKSPYTSEIKSSKSDYLASDVGSYSKGALYAPSAVITHNGHETAPSDTCNADELTCLSMTSQDRLALDAIKSLHRQLDDDADGIVDLSESDEFLREDLKYQDGYQRRQQAFHRNDDKHISVRELWDAWLRSEVHNWTVEQTVEWLTSSVELPQYASNFQEHRVTGATLPRLAVGNFQYLSTVLGIKDPIHKQKIALKAMDVVLFGPPKDYYHPTKDIILVTLLLGALVGCWWAYRQHQISRHHLRRMMEDMESLHSAEQALEDLQRKLENAQMEKQSVATEKLNLERKLLEQGEDSGKMSYSDLEVSQLKQEVEMLRNELQRAEGELQDRCWAPPTGLQHWLQLTHEIENKGYVKKRLAAEKQLQQAREACEKLRKKRSSLVGAFVSTHGKSIDDVDRSIVEARTSLNEVTAELQERVYRWKQIELLCGFNIINNNGLSYLESILYRNTPNGRGPKGLGRISSSQDDLDDDTGSLYSPSAGCLENWKEDSSGSEQSKNEVDDDSQHEARTHVPFIVGGDPFEDDITPIMVIPKKVHKNSMCRSQSHDVNFGTNFHDREREKDYVNQAGQIKLSQSDSNLDGPGPILRFSQSKKYCADCDEGRSLRKIEEHPRKNSDCGKVGRRMAKDQPEEDPKLVYLKNYRDRDLIDEEKTSSYRQLRETSDDFRRLPDYRDGSQQEISGGFRRTTSDDFRRFVLKENDLRRGGGGSGSVSSGGGGGGGGGEDVRRISLEDCRKIIEKARLEEASRGVADEKEETHSTDSNSTAADDLESSKKKKLKLFGNFRKNKSKLSS